MYRRRNRFTRYLYTFSLLALFVFGIIACSDFRHKDNQALIDSAEATTQALPTPSLSTDGRQVRLSSKTAPFPIGLYVMARKNVLREQVTPESPLVKIAKRNYIQAIAVGISWEDLQPSSAPPNTAIIQRYLEQIEAASKLAGRSQPLPVFLKLYLSKPPAWTMSSEAVAEPKLVKNKLGMTVVRIPPRQRSTGDEMPTSEIPISTDPVYHRQLQNLIAAVAQGLATLDPDARRIPLFHFVGPAMTSNQMRVPLPDLFPNQGTDKLGAGWTKLKHIEAWRSFASVMAKYPALAKRCWVFNFTNLADRERNKFSLSTQEQVAVFDAVRTAHPAGPGSVISKTESLTVNFGRAEGNQWRNQMLTQSSAAPYRYIAQQKFYHAWENWASFSPGRDRRSSGLYPVNNLIKNSLYLDLDNPEPREPQGTLWVEIWSPEVIRADEIQRLDNSNESLEAAFTRWDNEIRQTFQNALVGNR